MEFNDKILEIDQRKYTCGTLGKMDAVLRLAKQGYKRDKVLAGLVYIARKIPNATARNIAIDAYSKRVR